ncbi:bestrophin family protein [Pedobacter glucosidilyticus]|uniref:bestrophin family protein n=1 Tax=Pedobacter glucosidilyticus TaxID=1122941 RepID=UPI0026EA38F3|nr:bestrophin family ion channel [Pedobacter glucosidilyticus]
MLLKSKVPITYIFGKIKFEILFVAFYACIISILSSNYHIQKFSLPIAVPMIVGTVISLLLGFRSNQAYDRWWEARIIWGAIVNDSRTLARQLLSFFKDPDYSVEINLFQERWIKRQMAWCYCLGQSLRDKDPDAGLHKYLSKRDMVFINHHDHKPNAILQLHARDLKYALERGWINSYQQVEIDNTLTKLCDAMGKCERIKKTVFPTTYGMYIHFSIYFFVLQLPFSLMDFFGIYQIPVTIALAATFFLIEKMAVHLQDPFENKPTDTPVTSISKTIERNLWQMLSEREIPTYKTESKDFYIL